eukprot:TRINITY_DN8202_c0_g2_i3.p1 TRINITY_DN8202_c0_g2~~TRINITY_DN8202_c0_g2_i3.p1  ORF type:complete len:433 (-),score=97.27 TRINITY_DN8202_c0_g2_i3:111-1409(-)
MHRLGDIWKWLRDFLKMREWIRQINNPSDQQNNAIINASSEGHLEVVERLLEDERVDPSDQQNKAIINASFRGHLEVVERLLKDKRVDPSDQRNKAIINASWGHLEVVERLLEDERVDPSDRRNEAINEALLVGNRKMVERLLKHKKLMLSNQENQEIVEDASARGRIDIIELFVRERDISMSIIPHTAFSQSKFLSQRSLGNNCYIPHLDVHVHILQYLKNDFKTVRLVCRYWNWIVTKELDLGNNRLTETKELINQTQSYNYDRTWSFLSQFRNHPEIILRAFRFYDKHARMNEFQLKSRCMFILHAMEYHNLDPSFDNNQMIRYASLQCDHFLLPFLLRHSRVNPCSLRNEAIQNATSKRDNHEVIEILCKDGRIDPNCGLQNAIELGDSTSLNILLSNGADEDEAMIICGQEEVGLRKISDNLFEICS